MENFIDGTRTTVLECLRQKRPPTALSHAMGALQIFWVLNDKGVKIKSYPFGKLKITVTVYL